MKSDNERLKERMKYASGGIQSLDLCMMDTGVMTKESEKRLKKCMKQLKIVFESVVLQLALREVAKEAFPGGSS